MILEILHIFKQYFSTKPLSIKTPIASESTKIYTTKDLEVLVVSKEIIKYKEVL